MIAARRLGQFSRILQKAKELQRGFHRLLRQSYRMFGGPGLERFAAQEEDMFLLLCFSDFLGLPNPVSYYSLELLAFLAPEELERWTRRMAYRKSMIDTCWCCQ